jgi:hypothetical protein
VCQVGFVLLLHPLQVPGEGPLGHGWQDGDAILGALTISDDDLVRSEVDVLDSQAGAFEQAQPGTIEEGSHKPGRAVQLEDDRAHLVAGQNDGEAFRSPGPDDVVEPWQVLMQDVAVEEQERAQRLVLGRGGHPTFDGQGAEKACDFRRAHLGGMALAVEEDVAADPPDVGLLGAATAVAKAVGLTHAVEELGRARADRAGFPYDQGRVRHSEITHTDVDLEHHCLLGG